MSRGLTRKSGAVPVVSVCAAIIQNSNVTKARIAFGITSDCSVLLFPLQRKIPRRDFVWILQRENKTFQTVIRFQTIGIVPELPVLHPRFPLHRRKPAENMPFHVQNRSQSVCVTLTSAVKVLCFETIATATPQKNKPLVPEVCKDRRKLCNDVRIERSHRCEVIEINTKNER
jgi:hypothetical protein